VRVRLRTHQRRERESKGRETNRREWSMALRSAGSERERSAGRSVGAGLLGERDSELGGRWSAGKERQRAGRERQRAERERDSELGAGRGTLRVRGRRSLGQRAPVVGSESAGRWAVGGRRSWAVVEWSVGTGPSFGERERQRAGSRPRDGAGQRLPVVRRSVGEGTVAGEGEIWEIWEWRENLE
jgi:hypothetical protein